MSKVVIAYPECPRCGVRMSRTEYKVEDGLIVRKFRCNTCNTRNVTTCIGTITQSSEFFTDATNGSKAKAKRVYCIICRRPCIKQGYAVRKSSGIGVFIWRCTSCKKRYCVAPGDGAPLNTGELLSGVEFDKGCHDLVNRLLVATKANELARKHRSSSGISKASRISATGLIEYYDPNGKTCVKVFKEEG
jgi:hypothetical protein